MLRCLHLMEKLRKNPRRGEWVSLDLIGQLY
jgi:ribosomal protein L24E